MFILWNSAWDSLSLSDMCVCVVCVCVRVVCSVVIDSLGPYGLYHWEMRMKTGDPVAVPNLCCRHTGPRDAREWRFMSLSLRRLSEAGIKPESIVKPPGCCSYSGLHFSAPLRFYILVFPPLNPLGSAASVLLLEGLIRCMRWYWDRRKLKRASHQSRNQLFFFFNVCVCVWRVICVKNLFQLLKKILQARLTSL